MKKRKGQVGICVSIYLLLFVVIIAAFLLQTALFQVVKMDTEDALAASNLASAVIDLEEYGATHNIVISNPDAAFDSYKEALKDNMGLDNSWNSLNQTVISGPVAVKEYIVYNVKNNDVDIHYFGESRYNQTVPGGLGTVTAPNGQIIQSTSVYSRITFPVQGMFGVSAVADKDKLVDIVRN